jgi:outer membrane protein assembly factor BamB
MKRRVLLFSAASTLALAVLVFVCMAVAGHSDTATSLRPVSGSVGTTRGGASEMAKEILAQSGIQGGLIVQLGCGDGKLTAALRANDRFIVQGLDAEVTAARKHIQSLGLYGPVSAEQWSGSRLPYADNLVNLVVAEKLDAVPMDEVLRVLVPNGVALVGGKKTVKPRPKEIDDWTHFLHDAGNNAVADDTRVGAPRSMQWLAPPLWLRSHETPSGFEALVCGGGRTFYILDEGLIGITDQRLPERWALLCRDAYNGKLLWRRPLRSWGWPQWDPGRFAAKDWTTITGGRTAVPYENQRRIVVDGGRLFVTLSYQAPLTILDAATGKTLATVPETAPVRQILAADGVAVVLSQTGDANVRKRKPKAAAGPAAALIAVQGATGTLLWREDAAAVRGLLLAIDGGRVIYQAGPTLVALDLQTGRRLWQAETQASSARTLVAHDGLILLRSADKLAAHDAADGRALWQKRIPASIGLEDPQDLFVIDDLVWPGLVAANENQQPTPRGASVVATGYDLRTGAERKRVFAKDVLSPEHHHRCYRNKATGRYVIASMEGAEFIDLEGTNHSQNNFVRGACKLGMMPANGMLYVTPDQCFCQPGAKVLGLVAIGSITPAKPLPDAQRLDRGPAYSSVPNAQPPIPSSCDWPTYRHDAARHGTTMAAVGSAVTETWRVKLGGSLTAPVAMGNRVFVAACDAHTLHVLDMSTGKPLWSFVAGGRIDSPPTVTGGLVLFGSADGWVYCLRAEDGVLAWRFLAAAGERLIVSFDQVESAWPVHGSVLIRDGVAYVAAGRSTYLDGGIRLYALEPATGKILHRTTLSGPFPDGGKTVPRDVSYYINGANSDILVSEGDSVYLRQKRLTPALEEVKVEALSSKGEADVGRHVFATASLLDGSWYNRTFWMYSGRWPGYQLANQAPKSGQLLVVDEANTYAVKLYYRRNVHSPMFFPGKEGYLLYADKNSTEPQVVGEAGARKPLTWLPQSEYQASSGLRKLDSPAFGLDKMIGYTRAEPPLWTLWVPVRIRAMVKAGDTLFVAGPPDEFDAKDPYAAFEGRKGGRLVAVSAKDGTNLAQYPLDTPPVFDGLIAAQGRLLMALEDGSVICLGEKPQDLVRCD